MRLDVRIAIRIYIPSLLPRTERIFAAYSDMSVYVDELSLRSTDRWDRFLRCCHVQRAWALVAWGMGVKL